MVFKSKPRSKGCERHQTDGSWWHMIAGFHSSEDKWFTSTNSHWTPRSLWLMTVCSSYHELKAVLLWSVFMSPWVVFRSKLSCLWWYFYICIALWLFVYILTGRDVNLHLWRKVAEPEQNEIRKVNAMWTVRTARYFLLHRIYLKSIAFIKYTAYNSLKICLLHCILKIKSLHCLQEIPPTCRDTFTSIIKVTPYKDHMPEVVNYTHILCDSSSCEIDVNRDAHIINLRVYQNETLLGEDSVYVPATGESE